MTSPTLLLIHGLGATAGVWSDLVESLDWDGRVLAPELPGHGAAHWNGDYTVGALAAAVSTECDKGEPVVVVGHSLGGAVGICLASGFFRPVVRHVIGLGIKVAWPDEDVHGMARVAERGVRWFRSRDEAVERFLRQAGLVGLVGDDHPSTDSAVVELDGKWRVAQDPATFAQNPLDMAALMRAATCPVLLGAGEHDALVSERELSAFVERPMIAAGRGHNVQIEDPGWVASLIADTLPRRNE